MIDKKEIYEILENIKAARIKMTMNYSAAMKRLDELEKKYKEKIIDIDIKE